jgi:hypothetical protein
VFIEHYRAADTVTRFAGVFWYRRARITARDLGARYGHSTRTVAGVLACVSQQVTWKTSVEYTEDALRGKQVRHYSAVKHKVRDILAGKDPEEVLRGPKIRAFFRAIMGAKNAVVLDTWMIRAATGEKTCTEKQYREISAVLRDEARAAGMRPCDFQAIVWCHVRGEWK